jgi:anaerobic ribonucleoside-triphosphate reductase activating protein
VIPVSEGNGPGPHYTIWVQGCTLRCQGCFNPHTHNRNLGFKRQISDLVNEIGNLWRQKLIRGVTITGGEPFQQLPNIIKLVQEIKQFGPLFLSNLYTRDEFEDIPLLEVIITDDREDLTITGMRPELINDIY